MTKARISIVALVLLALGGCKLGPNYQRPPLTVPDQYRGLAPDQTTQQQSTEDFALMKWSAVFQDETLRGLIKEALANNYNMQIAATQILQASANLGIVRANQFPTVGGTFSIVNQQATPLYTGAPTIDTAGLQLNYIVDFWGQYRRATEAARAQLLSTVYVRDVVQITLVSLVAQNYFLLGQYDLQLTYSKDTVEADKQILNLNTIKYKGGDAAITDVYQAQVLVQQAEAEVISVQQAMEQTENNISILLGKNPQGIARGLNLMEQPHLPDVPAGLPSALLQRRPDVRRDEESLVAANANVGVAKAAFFPQISLTGQFGAQSTAISSFLLGPATFWAVGGQIAQPIFEGGRIRSGYRLAWAQRDQAELVYKQTVLNAFGDVSNSLVGYNDSRKYRAKIEEQTQTYRETARLATVRYQGGVTSFLEVLVTEQDYFGSELLLAQAWFQEMQNYVQLYQALGGGWDQQ
ncbi:MAG: efflux transporter outer membrane subunit [Candidatus Korobacteraceae bacterium]